MSCTLVVILTSPFYSLVSHDTEQCCDTHAPVVPVKRKSTSEAALACGYSRVLELSTLERAWTGVDGTKVGKIVATYRNALRYPPQQPAEPLHFSWRELSSTGFLPGTIVVEQQSDYCQAKKWQSSRNEERLAAICVRKAVTEGKSWN